MIVSLRFDGAGIGMCTPIAMVGNIYFRRFLTSGMPWCLNVEPLVGCRSISPPSEVSFSVGSLAMLCSRPTGSAAKVGFGRSGDVALARNSCGNPGVIVGRSRGRATSDRSMTTEA